MLRRTFLAFLGLAAVSPLPALRLVARDGVILPPPVPERAGRVDPIASAYVAAYRENMELLLRQTRSRLA